MPTFSTPLTGSLLRQLTNEKQAFSLCPLATLATERRKGGGFRPSETQDTQILIIQHRLAPMGRVKWNKRRVDAGMG